MVPIGFHDTGTFITLAPSLWSHIWPIALVAIGVGALRVHLGSWKPWTWIVAVIAVAFSLANNLGSRLVFGPESIRETRWFRESGYLEWRHVLRARTETRALENEDGGHHYRLLLALALQTGEDWVLDLEDLDVGQRQRLLDFARAHVPSSN